MFKVKMEWTKISEMSIQCMKANSFQKRRKKFLTKIKHLSKKEVDLQDVPGGMCQTSGECSLC